MKRAFVDTSAWFAYARADDPGHEAVADALERWAGRLVSSDFVFDETVTLVLARGGHAQAVRLGRWLRESGGVELARVGAEDEEEAWSVFQRHKDKGFSFTDCSSFALMRRLGIYTAVATDRHFRQAGFDAEP